MISPVLKKKSQGVLYTIQHISRPRDRFLLPQIQSLYRVYDAVETSGLAAGVGCALAAKSAL